MAPDSEREKRRLWHASIKSAIFELDMKFDDSADFHGSSESFDFGSVNLTRVESTPVSYHRHHRLCDGADPRFLICLPLVGEVELQQLGRRTRCRPGGMLLEHSDEPYLFEYGSASSMWTVLMPQSMLEARARNTVRFCGMDFDAQTGVGRLFSDYLKALAGNPDLRAQSVQLTVATQLADLLSLVLKGDPRILQSTGSSVKNAHLARIEQYLRRNLSDSELSAQSAAAACGISVRYLHLLFKDTDLTFAQWVREHRLHMAHEALTRGAGHVSIAQIAYQHGFNDHAQFSSAFKKKYGCSPTEAMKAERTQS